MRLRPKPRASNHARLGSYVRGKDPIAMQREAPHILANSGATLPGFDQDEWARLGDYDSWTPRAE